MKTNGTRIILVTVFLYLLLVVFTFSSVAQPDYNFGTFSSVTGTPNSVGAVYRYDKVKTGVDALVTITAISSGITLTDIDGSSGYPEALQPDIKINKNTSGYVELKIDFLIAGTNTPMIQSEVPTTCIDIDGASGVNEFDQIRMAGAYTMYDITSSEISVNYSPGWVLVTNIGNIDYPGRDTTAKQVMFTVVHGTTSSVILRVGATNNSSASTNRLRSVYFKKFVYTNAHLATNGLLAFRGTENNQKVTLNWDIRKDAAFSAITVEKSSNAKDFHPISEFWLTESIAQNGFRYSDNETIGQGAYYRLKLVAQNGQIQYSNILAFRNTAANSGLRVYPTLVKDQTTVTVTAAQANAAQLALVELNGRVVISKAIQLNEGTGTYNLDGLDRLNAGTYAVIVKQQGGAVLQQKLVKY